jgi:SAM-dependent methyltransferase
MNASTQPIARSQTWQQIWDRKHGMDVPLHVADGFDLLSTGQYDALVAPFAQWMGELCECDVLEVGCGAGAFLQRLAGARSLSGVDYAERAVQRVRAEFEGDFRVAEAARLPFADAAFDVTFSFGVFFYFDSLDYARAALLEQLRVLRPGGRLFVFEVNDAARMDVYRRLRAAENRGAHRTSDVATDHMFYEKDFFRAFAAEHDLACHVVDEADMPIAFHSGAAYRFAVSLGPLACTPLPAATDGPPT